MKLLKYFFYCGLAITLACQPEDEIITDSPSARLLVSNDTVLFDTLLTEQLSITKRFRIYNPSENAVRIDRIRLGLGSQSSYRIIANGKEGPEITNEILSGGDSLLVLVDSEIDPNDQDLPYLVKDSVIIEWNTNSAHVKLVAWGQDAYYINAAALCDTTFSGARPFVIYDSLLVAPECTLRIEKGVKMFFNNNAALHVAGTLIVEGEKDSLVTFRNTRFDENYLEAPGQWGDPQIGSGIIFYPQSQGNKLSYCIIENASSGIYMGVPDEDDDFDLEISNTIIRHMTRYGIISFTSDIKAENSLIYNCGSSLVANLAGGNYEYIHCTLSNYPNFFLSEDPAVILSDNIETGGDPIIAPLKISLINNIIWGSGGEELIINGGGGSEINLIMESNIVRSEGTIPDNYTSTETNFPDFENPLSFNYRLDSTSFPVDKGTDAGLLMDLEGKTRDSFPDIGAYEYIVE
ncbi:MAG: right-handed parallel beta-helix repeat-containing protein [Cyclobacteriaceae bacterium]